MASEEEKKKYWCDQIKTMMGPCLITFAIPLMVPGITLTLVAFGNDNTFPKYGALHIIGILILGLSILFLMTGCILRFYWRPFITPDLEMHLSPRGSFRSVHTSRNSSKKLRNDRSNDPNLPPNQASNSTINRARLDNIPHRNPADRQIRNIKDVTKSESETEGTGSESERTSLTCNEHRKFDILASPRSRNMVPVQSESFDVDPNDSALDFYEGNESFEALQEFRKRRKKGRKGTKDREKKQDIDRVQTEIDQSYGSHGAEDGNIQASTNEDAKRRRKRKDKSPSKVKHTDTNTSSQYEDEIGK